MEDDDEEYEDAKPETSADDFDVWAPNWAAVTAFLALDTQWRVVARWGGGFVYLGLDYPAVDVVLRRRKADEATFDDLRLMEGAAIEVLNELVDEAKPEE
nr:DUF1799 domain-containing protein [Methylopila sp. M107]